MTTASDPDEVRREIERTQANLSQDVDALTEKVTPSKIVERRVGRVRDTATRLKDKVMGSPERQRPHGLLRRRGRGRVPGRRPGLRDGGGGGLLGPGRSVQCHRSGPGRRVDRGGSAAGGAAGRAPPGPG